MYIREEVEVWIDEEEILSKMRDDELLKLGYMRRGSSFSPHATTLIKELRSELNLVPYSNADILLHKLESILL